MAAPLADLTEGAIYLDTMLLYTFVRAEPKARPVLKGFFEAIEQGRLIAFTSPLAFDELAYRLLLAAIRNKYEGSPLDRLRDEEQKLMAEFYPVILPPLRLLRRFPNLRIVAISSDDADAMFDLMQRHELRPRDALHVAAMRKAGCDAMASNDRHFDRVPGLRRFEVAA